MVFNALGLQRHDLFELGDGQVERVAGGRCGRDRVLLLAELAQVNAAQELMGVDIVGRGLQQFRATVASASRARPVRK